MRTRRTGWRSVGDSVSSACPRLGFELRLVPREPGSHADRATIEDALAVWLHERGLSRAPATRDDGTQRIWREGSQTEHMDREAVLRWAADRGDVHVEAGPIVDLDDVC